MTRPPDAQFFEAEHMTVSPPDSWTVLRYDPATPFDLAEILVRDFGGRAHWGKNRSSIFQFQRRIGKYGNNLKRFRQIVKKTDPKGMFANQFGVNLGLRWPQSPAIPANTETKGCVPD